MREEKPGQPDQPRVDLSEAGIQAGASSVRGRYNSSITRVRPFFTALLVRDPSGRTWLPQLLDAAPRAREGLAPELREKPGEFAPWVAEPRPYVDRVLRRT